MREKSKQIEKELHENDPQNVEYKNNLAVSYSKLGDMHFQLEHYEKALVYFKEYNQLEKELYENQPNNARFKRGLAISCQYLGNTYDNLGEKEVSLSFFQRFHDLMKELYFDFPENVDYKNGLAISYVKLASFYQRNGTNTLEVIAFYQKAREHWKELAERFPSYIQFQENLDWLDDKLKEF